MSGRSSDKVMPLSAAIRRYTRPGMSIHLGYGGGRPNAAIAELVRQYRGTSPGFTVSAQGFVNTQHALLSEGLVANLEVAYAGENYPSPRPNPALRRAVHAGTVTVRSWSLWTLTARLVAGALGVEFFPVRSLAGSGMADEHVGGDYREVSVFGPSTGVVRALRPDLVLLHGVVADPAGNVILPPPYGEGAWGALAARGGAIACVERVVDEEFVRRHNSLPMVPGHAVRAVCEAPFGSHPYGLETGDLGGVPGYREDDEFMAELRAAAREHDTLSQWTAEWMLGVGDHAGLLDKLGEARLSALRGGDTDRASGPRVGPATEDERMTLAAVRVLRERITSAGHGLVLSGIGYAHLASWAAVEELQRRGHDVELAAELGMSGFQPKPGDPYLFARQNMPTCRQLTDVMAVLGRDVAGPGVSSLGVLGAGLVDQHGNLNSTWSSSGDYLVGSGGANDVASAADEVVVVVKHARERLVEHVGYVTAPGRAVSTIVTSLAVLQRRPEGFTAVRYLADTDAATAAARIRAETGWDVRVDPALCAEPPPSAEDLAALRAFDPAAVFLR